MPVSITMPQLGESVTEGTVTRWLKDVGDEVAMDEPLLEVSTDKVDTEIPSPVAGILLEIKAIEDDVVPIGGELAIVGEAAELPASPPAPETTPVPEPSPPAAAPVTPTASAATTVNVALPALGESVTEGTVTRWLKGVGDQVAMDEPLVEVSTDKVDTEIPSPVAGTLLEIAVAEDETADVGATLAIISAGADKPSAAPSQPSSPPESAPPAVAVTASDTQVSTAPASPIVRKLARESGVDLANVTGTGVGNRITKADVQAAVASPSPQPTAAPTPVPATPSPQPAPQRPPAADSDRQRTEPMSRLRRVIAERMVESLHVSAQLTSVVEVDVTRIADLRSRAKTAFAAREGVGLSFLPFFARATIESLRAHPIVNASINGDDQTVTYHGQIHLGVAVDTQRGLLVPVIRDAGDLTLSGLARRIADLADRARTNKVSPDELSGGTFTLTNTGSRGALFDTPIINQPQVGILGTGAVVKRPVVITSSSGEDVIAIRSMAYLSLTYDHRLVDGADAARFLTTTKQRLESADFESELGL